MGGCGGALIAPDVVLFAAHCENWKDKQISIGAYKTKSTEDGAQDRFCDVWIADPDFNGSMDYDFALCKLNKPVTIDESKVRLEINDQHSVPNTGDDLVVMGLGTLAQGSSGPEYVHDVIVPTISNNECKTYSGYGGVSESMLCAGFPNNGGKDSCQGDSGGPIVQRITNSDGTIVDMHVGVVSWGIGCAQKNAPGVYARTSKGFPWIKSTMCNTLKSISSLCNNDPPPGPGPCDQDLTIGVSTDAYAYETKWTLTDSKKNNIMTRQYLFNNYQNEHKLCLNSNECYEWTVTDSYKDGMCTQGQCGSYSLTVNGNEVVSGSGNFGASKKETFCTGDGAPPIQSPTEAPVEPPTEAPVEPPTEAPVEPPTEAPVDPPTEAPVEPPTEAPVEPPTEAPVEPPTEAPVDPPTEAPVEPPTPSSGACSGNDEVRFQLKLRTDDYGYETFWYLTKKGNQESEFFGYDYQSNKMSILPGNDDYYCLEDDTCYIFEMYDDFGDGMSEGSKQGFFEGQLDGEIVFRGSGNFGYLSEREFCIGNAEPSPPDCEDSLDFFHKNKPERTCEIWVGKGNLKKIKKRCNKKWNQMRIYDWCPKTCGEEAGVGECAFLK
jgi:hypothetical protein